MWIRVSVPSYPPIVVPFGIECPTPCRGINAANYLALTVLTIPALHIYMPSTNKAERIRTGTLRFNDLAVAIAPISPERGI